MGRPTITSLARDLGVSRQTISNAIRKPELLAPDTLKRVRAGIEASGYVPSRAARALRTDSANTIALRVQPDFDGINGHILAVFLNELAKQARRNDYLLTVFSANSVEDEIQHYDRLMKSGDIDGVVLTSTVANDPRFEFLLENRLPFVSFGRPWETDEETAAKISWVDVDGGAGTYAVTKALGDQGKRRIGYLSWPIEPGVGEDRYQGWARACTELGVNDVEDLLRVGEDSVAVGAKLAESLILDGADAIVCASDTLALGAVSASFALRESQEPPHVIVGFDDTPVARALGISSVTQPIKEAAQEALDILLARLTGESEPKQVLLTPTPVFRDEEPVMESIF